MPLYTIRREIPGDDREAIDAASLRAISCAYEFPGLRWIRSYWDEPAQALLCLYESTSPEQIQEHSRRSRIPCDDIREVVEIEPSVYVDSEFIPPDLAAGQR